MSDQSPIEIPPGFVNRVKAILTTPKTEWPVIAAESASIASLYTRYICILAAIPAVATFLRAIVFGYGFLGVTYRPSLAAALAMGVQQYVMALIGVAIIGLLVQYIVPQFGGAGDRVQAFKLAAYSGTAGWLAGIFTLIPGLGFLMILGLYGAYLFYLGLGPLMQVPEDKRIACVLVLFLAAVVAMMVLMAVAAPFAHMFGGGYPVPGVEGGGSITVG
ncbi:Yip1 family protein [Sphingobium subterraneum]|uniref:Yip1 domain-containing protein n=1 Tax=Sphingobium subterraneum TaxID=627688 RepID=A0A841IZX7_9SPHN|nr:Yip1 family protein [Sphingobium subterraneum]MBB6123662.1 hypothetical protein [Sphingobium subterraneum]